MGGAAAVEAEVVRCLHDPVAEVVMPQAVDNHSWKQRIVRMREPLSQLPSSIVVRRILLYAKVAL